MKISYKWLKEYFKADISVEEAADLLTNGGLEVEGIETFETVKGALDGVLIGEVKSKEKHPDADRLNLTRVDVGESELLNIVCGAANVEVGQKVVVATIGATLYPSEGEPFKIKKSKIRGQLSEGMICAEDEIGLGKSHDGIMVLDINAKVGTPAGEYFNIESDAVMEVNLTPNRADAASHIGVARDLLALWNHKNNKEVKLTLPSAVNFKVDHENKFNINITLEDPVDCPRYAGLTISDVTVKASPKWLQNRLKSIGLTPINNIVDITNFILHEQGQPLHAFDADKIKGKQIIVKRLKEGTKFTTLDGIERKLSGEELMICNGEEEPLCIAGVFGGAESGVTAETKNIFIESAYFNPTRIRKAAKHHGLNTDASFRFERGVDPENVAHALQRATLLVKELAGGEVTSKIIDKYPNKIMPFEVGLHFNRCEQLIGKAIPKEEIKKIVSHLGIKIVSENEDKLQLLVPANKVDVTREADVIEEILRVYGYNNIELPNRINASVSYADKPDKESVKESIANLLSDNGCHEIVCNSLTKESYTKLVNEQESVKLLNPLSADLAVLRQQMLFNSLEIVSYNQNRKQKDLKLFEFGRTYHLIANKKYREEEHLSIILSGNKNAESWNVEEEKINFYDLKSFLSLILVKLGLHEDYLVFAKSTNKLFSEAVVCTNEGEVLAELGEVSKQLLKQFDLKQAVYFIDIRWDLLFQMKAKRKSLKYREVSKFPEVRRDLALLLDKQIAFDQLKKMAFEIEKGKLLKQVNIFDVYEGDKLPEGKKSYALSFTFQDEHATLTDEKVDKMMERLIKAYQDNFDIVLR